MKQLNTQSGNLSTLEFGPVDKMVTDLERYELANHKLGIAMNVLKRAKEYLSGHHYGLIVEQAIKDLEGK
ncbi:MAG: hypothetical protein QQN63_01470 [Nitrosopumilus sp.]